ncbi:hypothetical protein LWI28_018590 [Acer negundo]|uniref:Uncharacterized protein n=1 Tax=Acer negundo TaxID=4023 RepID=A0AAD5JI72_ACENE|nr:hypothetical protein LWI28_018590 [Acer negundo]
MAWLARALARLSESRSTAVMASTVPPTRASRLPTHRPSRARVHTLTAMPMMTKAAPSLVHLHLTTPSPSALHPTPARNRRRKDRVKTQTGQQTRHHSSTALCFTKALWTRAAHHRPRVSTCWDHMESRF